MESPTPLPDEDAAVVAAAREVAVAAVDELRPLLLAAAGTSRRHHKADGTPVTEADLQADATITAAIADAFPAHQVISEEATTTWDGSEWAWIIDPIDGTGNYAAGIPYWCVSIALAHRGEVVWGLVDAPPLDRRWEAVRGGGAVGNGAPVTVAAPIDLANPRSRHAPMGVTPGTIRRASPGLHFKARVMGAAALDLALVAEGSMVAAWQRVPKAWDVAAGALLVTEAGGAHVEFDDPGHLPLRRGVDLTNRSVVTAAGPDRAWLLAAAERLWPPR